MTGARGPAGVEVAPLFPVLDSLRAVGALAVLTTHVAFQSGAYVRNGSWGDLLSRLDVGVAIFFVLSGFLLSRPHFARRMVDAPPPPMGRYYWKRLLRIYPVYAVTVVLALTLIPENRSASAAQWVRSLSLTDIYLEGALPQGLTQMWSLSIEVSFYLILPLLMLLVLGRAPRPLRPARVALVLLAMVLLSSWWHLHLVSVVGERSDGNPALWLPSYLSWFAVGLALALADVLRQARRPRRAPGPATRLLEALEGSPGVCWALVLGLMLVASTPLAGPTLLYVATDVEALTKSVLYAAIGGLVVISGLRPPATGSYARVLSARLPRHLGHVSYSVFSLHLPILYLVMEGIGFPLFGGNTWQIWALTVALSLAASEVAYRSVELPALRLRNLGRRSSTSAPRTRPSETTTR
ncbi:MAG: acyltransferase [Nocardioides sp.]|nr:acyltransferase [Nocardioides sp.]